MKLYHFRKRCITLIEIMIVMFLIALIAGVVTYNYRGSLEEGKAFKTKAAMEKIDSILNLSVAEDPSLMDHISSEWPSIISRSPLVKSNQDLLRDGWGSPFQVSTEGNVIRVRSMKLEEYQNQNATLFKK